MVSQDKMRYVYIIGNSFVNTQSLLKILASKRNGFNVEYNFMYRKTLFQFLSYEGSKRYQPHATVTKHMFRHNTICTLMSFVE